MNKKLLVTFAAVVLLVVLGYLAIYTNRTNSNTSQAPGEGNKQSEEIKKTQPIVDTRLSELLSQWAQQQNDEYGIVVQEINNHHRTASYQADEPFVAASTYKLFLTYAVLHNVEQGTLALQSQTNDGRTLQQCIDAMLVRSDNSCGWPTGALIGWDTVDKIIKEQFPNTSINNYNATGSFTAADKITTAADQAAFMQKLAEGSLLNKEHSELMLSRMKEQIWRERIPAGVPSNIIVADKPGWLAGIQNDTAVVYGPKSTYVLVIMSSGDNVATAKLADLSQQVYDYLNS